MKKRQSTVEPVIGSLVNYTGMKRVNTKGLEQANKCVTLAAVVYNLKKLLKFIRKRTLCKVQALRLLKKESHSLDCLLYRKNYFRQSLNMNKA